LSIAPGGNSTTVIPAPGGGNNVVKGITSAGVVTLGQLAFSNLSGVATTAQGGMLTGGLNGQVLAKSSGSDYALQWLNLTGGGNVSSVATPVNGQLAQWTGPTTIQGLSAVPTTAAGLPTLGTTGQVLSKIDGTSYNTQWVTLPGGGNVISVGTPSLNQIAQWTDSTHAQGISAVPIAQGGTGAATAAAGTVFANNSNVTAAPAFVINPRITAISNLTTDGFVTTNSGIGTLSVDTTDYEPTLGNPASNGYVLSSTTAGVRSWVAGGGGGAVSSVFTRTGAVVAATNDYTFAQIGSKPTTLTGYGITDAQPLDAQLTDLAALSYATNALKVLRVNTGATGWELATISAGGGSVTDFSAGDLSPLFTTTEATTTTTPALSFALTNAAATTVFGRAAGTSGAPTYSASPQFTAIGNLTTNGFVKTGGGVGTLSVDTNTYLTTASAASTYQPLDTDLTAIGGLTGARGDVLYYGASGWAKLGAGTNGNQLTTHAAGADPTWDAPGGGGGGITSVPDANTLYVVSTGGSDATGTRGDKAKPYATIQAALTAASAGDLVSVGPGTWDLGSAGTGTNRIVIPANVSLQGAGQGITIIKSDLLGTSSPFTGFIVPGNNTVIRDLSAIAYKVGGGTQHTCPLRLASGASDPSYTNVRWENCHLYGLSDTIIATSGSFGDHLFVNCLFESANDTIMWQSASNLVLVNCALRRTTITGQTAQPWTALYDGGAGGNIKAYGCRAELRGLTPSSAAVATILEAGSHLEVYDFVIDYGGFYSSLNSASVDISTDAAGAVLLNNVVRNDNLPLKYFTATGFYPIEVSGTEGGRTVASLPASPHSGQVATVTDGAASLAYNATVTGGGSAKYLVYYNGTNWVVVGGGTVTGGTGSPGGSDTQVQFNDATAFGGDAGMVWDKTTKAFTISGAIGAGLKTPASYGGIRFDSGGTDGILNSGGVAHTIYFQLNNLAVGYWNNVAPVGFVLAANYPLLWSGTTDNAITAVDTGIYRNAGGVIEINNGTVGQYRDLKLRTLTYSALASGMLEVDGSGVVGLATAGTDYVSPTGTATLTNKAITPRISSQASNATWSPNADTTDVFVLTLQAAAATTINNPSGTPVDGQKMIIRAKCDGTARALTWSGSQWRGSTDVALPSTLTASKTMYMGFIYNSTDTKWDIVAKTDGF
jgi:hypothetical protein